MLCGIASASQGLVAPLWPKEQGGPGWSITERFIFEQETSRAGRAAGRSARHSGLPDQPRLRRSAKINSILKYNFSSYSPFTTFF
jgi:hypothetical protein